MSFLSEWGGGGVRLRWFISPRSDVCVTHGKRLGNRNVLPLPVGKLCTFLNAAFSDARTAPVASKKHLSVLWRDGSASLDGVGAFRRKKKMMSVRLSKSFGKIQTESDGALSVLLLEESVFIKHF